MTFNDGHLKFPDFDTIKMGKTPQNIPQSSTFPIITHLECGCYEQPEVNKDFQ